MLARGEGGVGISVLFGFIVLLQAQNLYFVKHFVWKLVNDVWTSSPPLPPSHSPYPEKGRDNR